MFPLSAVVEPETTQTSHAEITLKSATLPRRKPTKMEVQVEVKPKVSVVGRLHPELHLLTRFIHYCT